MKNELFIISPRSMVACDKDAVNATARDLLELGLFKLPYPKIDLMIKVEQIDQFTLPRGSDVADLEDILSGKTRAVRYAEVDDSCLAMIFKDVDVRNTDGVVTVGCTNVNFQGWEPRYSPFNDIWQEPNPSMIEACKHLTAYLIVLLATRNVEKQFHENKLAKLGIGKKRTNPEQSYPRVTTVTIPAELPDDPEHATEGKPKAPHLRRGHIRRQHYGPQRAFIKQVWIEPVFVNADKDFVSNRKAYNLNLGVDHAHSS